MTDEQVWIDALAKRGMKPCPTGKMDAETLVAEGYYTHGCMVCPKYQECIRTKGNVASTSV